MSRTAHKLMASGAKEAYEIDQSIMFNLADTSYLKRDYGSGANSYTKWTFSTWFKNTSENYAGGSLWTSWDGSTQSDTSYGWIGVYQDKLQIGGWSTNWRTTNRVFRDVGAWYHIVIAIDTNESTADNRVRIYINGVEETSFATKNNPSTNTQLPWNKQQQHRLGAINSSTAYYLGGYLAETQVIDGSQLTPSSFGETDSGTGQWIPKKYEGTYPAYSFYLPFKKNDRYCVYFDGSTSTGITTPDHTDFTLGTNNFTIEAWIYRDEDAGNTGYICGQAQSDGADASAGVPALYIDSNNKPHSFVFYNSGSSFVNLISSTTINDNEWNHVALVRNSNTFTIYLNGTSVASNTTSLTVLDSSNKMGVGVLGEYTAGHFKGWISNFRLVNGTAVYTSNFTPSTSPLTAITNTKLLCCQDSTVTTENSGTSKTLTVTAANSYTQQMSPFTYDWYQDQSGQDNHFTADNLTVNDVYLDSPTNNFSVHNSRGSSSETSFTVGNLWGKATSNNFSKIISTLAPASGKWYCEYYVKGSQHNGSVIGTSTRAEGAVIDTSNQSGTALNDETTWLLQHNTSANQRIYRSSNVEQEDLGNVSVGDVLSIAMDVDNSKVYFRKNNTIVGSSSGHTINTVEGGDRYFFAFHPRAQTSYTGHGIVNYGQNSSFNGLKIAQGNTDGNGIGDFYYSPPSGFLALCTKNLPTLAIKEPEKHFNPVIYTGSDNDAVSQSVTGVGFEPDLVIIKKRNATASPAWWDQVRGEHKGLNSDGNDAEITDTYGLETFDSDGFTVRESQSAQGQVNTGTLVAWNWKAGGSTSANTAGDINSTVSVNNDAGFSIVTYTGNRTGAGVSTVGHGLSVAPKLVITKSRSNATSWWIQHPSTSTASKLLRFDTTAETDKSGNGTLSRPTSTVFGTNWTDGIGTNGHTMVAYCFAEVEGFSKFGKYEANNSTNGPFINTGFTPAWVMYKYIDGAGEWWWILDSTRDTINLTTEVLYANATSAESSIGSSGGVDFLSNGFKIRATNGGLNSANTYVYMAFAESPFKYANAR